MRSGVPATPGAPPEVFAEARMEMRGRHPGLFYIRIESAAETILTDFLWWVVAVQMSVYPTIYLYMKPLAKVGILDSLPSFSIPARAFSTNFFLTN